MPIPISAFARSTAMNDTCAIDEGGRAWCWGTGFSGELGTGDEDVDEVPSPAPVDADEISFAAIDTGASHTCAKDEDGDAWCWGSAGSGRLGDDRGPGESSEEHAPVEVAADPALVHDSSRLVEVERLWGYDFLRARRCGSLPASRTSRSRGLRSPGRRYTGACRSSGCQTSIRSVLPRNQNSRP